MQDALKIKEQENEALKETVSGKGEQEDNESANLELISLKTKLTEKDLLIEKVNNENKSLKEETENQLRAHLEQMYFMLL
mgnify:FL=1